jgi:diacylglycerol O-acyltransferase / wax synthase
VTGTSPEELSADDARILELESHAIAGHTLKLLVLEPDSEPLGIEHLRELIAGRLPELPRARQRIEVQEGTHESLRWVQDERFEIAAHVRERVPAGGDREALWRLTGEVMAERLDHSRPLWAIDLVGPLADGGQAMIARIHHAMADGISCMRLLETILWDAEPISPRSSTHAARARQGPSHPARGRVRELAAIPAALWRELAGHASRSDLDRRIGAARSLAFAPATLQELKEIGGSLPGHVTVNDVLLAIVAGGLARWWANERERLPRIRAQVPVSLHNRDERDEQIGNRDSFLNIDLPLAEPSPLRRVERISAETQKRKRLDDADELYDFFHALACVGPLERVAERLVSSPREFSLSVSNVPGPPTPISVAGRRVESLGSVAEPAQRHALRVSALSCAGSINIGLCTDPEVLPGVERLAAALDHARVELRAATIG